MVSGDWKDIEDIQPGEIVLSVSDGSPEGEVGGKAVVRAYHNKPQPLVHLHSDGGMIRTTAGHPFYVCNKGWIPASQLQIADRFRGYDGQSVELRRRILANAVEPVFNLQVADNHTYFVGAPGGRRSVLVRAGGPRRASDKICNGIRSSRPMDLGPCGRQRRRHSCLQRPLQRRHRHEGN